MRIYTPVAPVNVAAGHNAQVDIFKAARDLGECDDRNAMFGEARDQQRVAGYRIGAAVA